MLFLESFSILDHVEERGEKISRSGRNYERSG